MDLSNSVVELFLSWNDGNANAEMRVKVKHTILALKKCKNLSTMADVYREKLCETIRVTIRTTVTECAVDAAKDFKKPLVQAPSATIVSIPSKDSDESNKTSITEGVTSMTFEQFMDCLDMIFEQSLSLLRSAAKVNKFCLEEGISLKEDETSRDVSALSAASDLSHKSISEILRLRKYAHSLITFQDMRRLWDSCLAFTLQVEKVSGQKAYGLRSTLHAQAKAFVELKHEANMSSLVAALDGERWNQCDVSLTIFSNSPCIFEMFSLNQARIQNIGFCRKTRCSGKAMHRSCGELWTCRGGGRVWKMPTLRRQTYSRRSSRGRMRLEVETGTTVIPSMRKSLRYLMVMVVLKSLGFASCI